MKIMTVIYTKLCGELVGRDSFGNAYYIAKKPIAGALRQKRWVLYKGESEASRVPPDWHGWLHHSSDVIPQPHGLPTRQNWIQPPQPNLTGTAAAYLPPGHPLHGQEKRAKATGDYHAWQPR
jgi:NADH:ubiquinone oxidoreductase subunit